MRTQMHIMVAVVVLACSGAMAGAGVLAGSGAMAGDPPIRKAKIRKVGGVKTFTDFLRLPPGFSKRGFFEFDLGAGSIGYSDATLESKRVESKKDGDEVRYAYTHVIGLRFGDGTRSETTITADLSTEFVPRAVKNVRATTNPDGELVEQTITVTINDRTITIHDTGGDKVGPRALPRGPDPFVMALDAAVELMDFKHHPQLLLNEFDMQSGTVELLGFKSEPGPNGTVLIQAGTLTGRLRYRIRLGPDGKLLEWENIKGGLLIKRCSKERAAEIKERINMG